MLAWQIYENVLIWAAGRACICISIYACLCKAAAWPYLETSIQILLHSLVRACGKRSQQTTDRWCFPLPPVGCNTFFSRLLLPHVLPVLPVQSALANWSMEMCSLPSPSHLDGVPPRGKISPPSAPTSITLMSSKNQSLIDKNILNQSLRHLRAQMQPFIFRQCLL